MVVPDVAPNRRLREVRHGSGRSALTRDLGSGDQEGPDLPSVWGGSLGSSVETEGFRETEVGRTDGRVPVEVGPSRRSGTPCSGGFRTVPFP